MRLTPAQQRTARAVLTEQFGPDARVLLFGSKRGGDFDFFVEVAGLSAEALVRGRIRALARLHHSREFAERKVDLVVCNRDTDAPLPIHTVARETGVPL